MKIAVFGAGAIGSLMGALLSARNEVTLIGREAHVLAIEERGMRITGQMDLVRHPQASTGTKDLGHQDMILITVKAFDTEKALEEIEPLMGEKTTLVSLQNGLWNAELICSRHVNSVMGITSWRATMVAPGVVRLAGRGDTVFGSIAMNSRAADVAAIFSEAGVTSRRSKDIMAEIWMKAIVNACVNPITAILREPNGVIERDAGLIRLVEAVCEEGARAARANGILLPGNPLERAMEVVNSTADNKSSMLQDIEHGRRTEIDQISGALVLKGEKRGVPMSINRALWTLVRGLTADSNPPLQAKREQQNLNNAST